MWPTRYWAATEAHNSIFDLIMFTPGGIGMAKGKLVGGKSVLTSSDKHDI